jgi:hypothetical protein
MSRDRVQFRADADLVEHVEAVADTLDISKSEAWREAAKRGLADVADDADDLEHVAFENRIDTIRREAKPEQMEAWFRNRASSHLLRCWNGRLTPEEARKSMSGYLRAATEEYDRDDYREYVEEGLSLYADAYQRSNAHIIVDWCKNRADVDDLGDDAPGGFEADDAIPADTSTPTATEDGKRGTYREALAARASWVRTGMVDSHTEVDVPDGFDVAPDVWRPDLSRMVDADDPENVDLRGDTDE